jgi:formylglycine-generating enzyme required for sulfatase activity
MLLTMSGIEPIGAKALLGAGEDRRGSPVRVLLQVLAVLACGACTGTLESAQDGSIAADSDQGSGPSDQGGEPASPTDAGRDRSREPDSMPGCTNDCVPMIWIPPATFLMGANGVPGESNPQHSVTLSKGFWIDKYEVSQKRYQACVSAGACTQPCASGSVSASDEAVRGVCWEQATAYCQWAGKRLPTEAEWEHAACGDGSKCYPWGGDKKGSDCTNHPACDMAAFCPESQCAGPGPCYKKPQSVTSFETSSGTPYANKSPFGVVNMAGNVWEWVQDTWTANFQWCSPSCTDPLAKGTGADHVFKGGAWVSEEVFLRCAARYWGSAFPGEVGLRCAR